MDHLRPRPQPRRSVSERTRRLISYAWIVASLALPALGVALISQGIAILPEGTVEITHEVRPGDTLTAIALRYDVTVDEIVQANGLTNPNMIYVGQMLIIPRQDETGQQVHIVQVGESLAMIARRYGVSTEDIIATNGLADVNSIYAGQRLIIPGVTGVPTDISDYATYTVKRGDSLYRISLVFGVSVDDLLAANNLPSPNAIYAGLVLRIPAPGGSTTETTEAAPDAGGDTGGHTYMVQAGDTLASIAISFNVTVDGLVAANGLASANRIYPGQTLNIPEPGATARPYPAQTGTTHRVQLGETLYAIALRYGVTTHALAVANGISNPSRIYVGMVLSIPSAQAGSSSVVYGSVGSGLCPDATVTQSGTGYFIRPVRGYVITQQFHPWHAGIDLALKIGSPVYASDGGTVIFSGWNPAGYGNLIILDHGNGWRSYYAHLSKIDVGCGEWIPRGSIIGEIGSTGNSTGPHLHFELLRFGLAINPAGYIRF